MRRLTWNRISAWWVKHPIVGGTIQGVSGVTFIAAFVGMFFTDRYPVIKPFVIWTLRIWAGVFVATIVGFLVIFGVIAPSVNMAGELADAVTPDECSALERRLTIIWGAVAGVLFSLTIGVFYALLAFGVLSSVKAWFVALCATVILVPWFIIGGFGRRAIWRAEKKLAQREQR